MLCVLLAISDIATVLIILGGLQIAAVLVALMVLLLPVLVVDTEPRIRMLKWILPRRAHVWSFRHVLLTKIVDQQYPKSVSEYSGARGSTQHQMLSAICTVTGTLQVTIAFCLWVADEADVAKMLVLIAAGVCCVLIGQMESALPWKNVVNELQIVKAYLLRYRQLQQRVTSDERERAPGGDLPQPGSEEAAQQGPQERQLSEDRAHQRRSPRSVNGSANGSANGQQRQRPDVPAAPSEEKALGEGERHSTDAVSPRSPPPSGSAADGGEPLRVSPNSQTPTAGSALTEPTEPTEPPERTNGASAVVVQRDRQSGAVRVRATDVDLRMISNFTTVELRGDGLPWLPEPPLADFYDRQRFEAPAPLPEHRVPPGLTDPERAAWEAFIAEKHRTRELANQACSGQAMRYISPQYTRIVPLKPLDVADFESGETDILVRRHHRVDQWQIFIPTPHDAAELDAGDEHRPERSASDDKSTAWQPAQADGMALRLVGREGGGHKDRPSVHDNRIKNTTGLVHMAAALCFVVLNFIAEGVQGSAAENKFRPTADQSRTDISAAMAFTGLFLFLVFSVLSWLSGGYDDLLGNRGKGYLSCCMAREVAPSLVCYQQYPGHSGVQVGVVERGDAAQSFSVRPRACCAFASCPSWCPAPCHDAQFAVDERDYVPNWYDRHFERRGSEIDDCLCADYGPHSRLCMWLSRCCLRVCVQGSCCCRQKRGAALLGIGFILLETGAFALLVVSVAVEAVSVAVENPQVTTVTP